MGMLRGGWGGGQVFTDEERERLRQELIAATGGQWNPGPMAPVEAKMPLDLTVGAPPSYGNDPAGVATEPWGRPGDMHNPGWGIERPGDAGVPYQTRVLEAGGGNINPVGGPFFGAPYQGTLGGAAGMGQPMSLYERGGGQSAYGGAPQAGGPYGMAPGGIGTTGRQSPTPYGMGRQSPTPYGMGRPSPTPYQGSGYSTLGGMSGYGRRY